MTDPYKTSSGALAACLRYSLGDAAHLATNTDALSHATTFEFSNPEGECERIAGVFFSPEGAMVEDAKSLLEAERRVRKSIVAAIANGSEWRNPNAG